MTTRGRTSLDDVTTGQLLIACYVYLRLSDGRHEGGTFVEREQALRAGAAARGWHVRGVVVENDLMGGSKSASAFRRRRIVLGDGRVVWRVWRPGFRGLLEDLRAGHVQAILGEDLDRILRDPRDFEDLVDVIQECRGWADSLTGSLRFTRGGTDQEIYQARGAMNHANLASKDTARRVAQGRERVASRALWGGGRRPYGFTPVSNPSGNHRNTQLTVCEAEAEEIRRAAKQVIGGVTLKAAARDMIGREVRTVTGTRWTAETLREVLLRPLNAGIVVYDGKETDVRLPGDPILPEDVWRGVVAVLTDPSRSSPGRAPSLLGTGIYECACGSVMEFSGGRNRAVAYRCAHEGGTGDTHTRRLAHSLDDFVSRIMVERLSKDDAADLFAPRGKDVDLPAIRRQIKSLTEHGMKLARMLGVKDLTDAEFAAARRENMAKIERLEKKIKTGARSTPLGELATSENVAETWKHMTLGQKREAIKTAMRVIVLPARRGRGFDENAIRIDWKTQHKPTRTPTRRPLASANS